MCGGCVGGRGGGRGRGGGEEGRERGDAHVECVPIASRCTISRPTSDVDLRCGKRRQTYKGIWKEVTSLR